jgi:hypothetical protein
MGQGEEVIVPVLDALNFGKIFSGVDVADDLGADRMQPFVAVGMVEVPMGVDQMGDGIGPEVGERLGDLRAGDADTAIDQHLAVRAGEHRDVTAGALEYADIVSQLVGDDRRHRRAVLDHADEAARFRVGLTGRQPAVGCGKGGAADAAQAKAATRQQVLL